MHISNINNQPTPNFNGLKIRKLTNDEINQLKTINSLYDDVFLKLSKYNLPSRIKFKSPFPGLLDKAFKMGLLLHVGEDLNSEFHIHKFGQNTFAKIDILDEDRKPSFACSFINDDEIKIKTSEKYDANPQNDIETSFKELLSNAIKEMKFLVEYTRAFDKIRKILPLNNTKAELAEIIKESKKITKITPTTYAKSKEIQDLIKDYEDLNKLIYHRHGLFTALFKEAYFQNKDFYREKGITFDCANGEKINFLPMNTKDGRNFRIYKYDKDNNLKLGLFGYSDGTMAKIKKLHKQVIPANLAKILDKDVEEFEIPKMVEFLSTEIAKFKNFIEDIIANNRLIRPAEGASKVIPLDEYTKTRTIIAEKLKKREELKAEKEFKKAQKLADKLAKKEAKQAQKLADKQVQKEAKKLERIKQKELEKKEKQNYADLKIKKQREKETLRKFKSKNELSIKEKEIASIFDTMNKIVPTNQKSYKELSLNEIVYKIESVFQTPVEKRHPRYSHLKMKDGTIFNSQVSILADDGAKITVKKIKSSRYADFTYYAISAEKDGIKSTINIDPDNGRIIYSDENDKPIIIGGVVQHIRRNEAINKTHCPESWDKYFYQLFNIETNDGKIENSDLQKMPKKKYRPEEDFEKELMLTSLYSFDS